MQASPHLQPEEQLESSILPNHTPQKKSMMNEHIY